MARLPNRRRAAKLLEEVGVDAKELTYLGNFFPDTGRSQTDSHAFSCTIVPAQNAILENGISLRYVLSRNFVR